MKAPYFWSAGLDPRSREAAPLTRVLLTPFAWVYAAITAQRLARTSPLTVDAKVICVGNITAGGVGKSPVVALLRAHISAMYGVRVATLSRGYGGRLKGPLKVDPEIHSARDVGDEPIMLSHTGETWIGGDRAEAGLEMSRDGVDVIIMDDGHQNPGLSKDLSLVVVDSEAAFGNGYVIPKGPLREPVRAGLARASAVILLGGGLIPHGISQSSIPILHAAIVPARELPAGPYVAFAGIGKPQKFFDTLTAIGADVKDCVPFDDHHVYSNRNLDYLHKLASDHSAGLVTTEKDFARLNASQRVGILTLPVKIQFEQPDALDNLLQAVLKTTPE